jgi:WD40 repeat protein/serine/threonine protein kinase
VPLHDPRLIKALEEYRLLLEAGGKPDRREFQARHAEISAALADCLDGLEFIHTAAPQLDEATSAADIQPEAPLGDYRIVREIGRGGMGVVYEAVQISLGRRVALKVLPFAAALDAKQLQRFKNEAQAAAHLHHQNIVPVYAVGCERAVHFYAMQLIEGQTLSKVIADFRLQITPQAIPQSAICNLQSAISPTPPPAVISTEQSTRSPAFFRMVASLGVQAAQALEHAHAEGVVHRDIKPANLLVDLRGNLWITDFGLAHCQSQAGLTMSGDLVGTLRYMSPEQALAQRVVLDHRTDIYSVGATFYELLTLEPVFAGGDRQELLRQIAFEEPKAPRRWNKSIPAELETILLKALEKNPDDRYATAQELADDLGRFLRDESIRAKRPSFVQWARKWARRHQPLVWSALAAALAVLFMAVAMLALSNARTHDEQQRTQKALGEKTELLWKSYVNQARASRLSRRLGQRFEALAVLAKATALARERNAPAEDLLELRNETIACLALLDVRVAKEWEGYPAGSTWVDFDGGLERYARVDRSGSVSIRGVAGDENIYRLPGMGPGATCHFRNDGQFLAVCFLGRLQVWKLTGPQPLLVLEEPNGVHNTVAFLPASQEVVIGHWDGSLSRCDLASGKRAERVRVSLPPLVLAAHPSEKKLAIACDTHVQIFDLQAAKVVAEFQYPKVVPPWIAWHPDGRSVAAVDGDNAIHLWDVATRKEIARLQGYKRNNNAFAFSHAGDVFVSANRDDFLGVWDPRTGEQRFSTEASVVALRFSPDDRLLAGGIDGSKLRVWEIARACGYRTFVRDPILGRGRYRVCAVSPKDRLLAVGMTDGVGLWDLNSGKPLPFLPIGFTRYLLFEESGALVTNGSGGLLRFPIERVADRRVTDQGDPAAPRSLRIGIAQKLPLPGSALQIASSRDGRVLASAQGWGGLVWCQGVAGAPLRLPHEDTNVIAVSPNGRWVATGNYGTKLKIWEAESGKGLTELPVEGDAMSVVFSPNGRWLATGGPITRLWEVGSWQERQRFPAASRNNTPVAFSADSSLFAFEAGNGAVRLVDPDSGREFARLEDPNQDRADELAFSPDCTQLVTNGEGVSIHVWDLRAIQKQLSALDLNWGPASPPAGEAQAVPPLQVTFAADVLVPCPYAIPGDWGKAIADYSEVIRSSPHNAGAACNDLAWLLATCPDPQFRDPARAVGLANRAVDLGSKDGLFHNTLGVAQYRAGDWKAARASLQQAMQLRQGGDSFTWFFLAMVHWQLGDNREAWQWYDQAIQWTEKNQRALAKDAAYGEQLGRFRAEAGDLLGVQARQGFQGHTDQVRSAVFSPDGTQILSGGFDSTARLWDVATGQGLVCLQGHTGGLGSVALSRDGRRALSGSLDRTMRLWDVAAGKELLTLQHADPVWSVAFSPDGRRALAASASTVYLWDLEKGKELTRLKGHTEVVRSVAFSPDGRQALSGGEDNTVRLWDLATGKEVRRFDGHTAWILAVAFSPDGRRALSGGTDETVRLWQVATGRQLACFRGHRANVESVAFAPDGRRGLSGGTDGTIRLWDLQAPCELYYIGTPDEVLSVAFSPDGRQVLAANAGKTVRLWSLPEKLTPRKK